MKRIELGVSINTIGLLITSILITLLINKHSLPCDIAVVSSAASTDGRPFIWKSRDNSASYNQEVQYFEAENLDPGGNIMVYNHDDGIEYLTGSPVNSSGGVNESGFAITCTAVYEDYLPHHEYVNINTDLNKQALLECVTLDDFENLLENWHETHWGRVISGNFAVIDAHGGAAMYECWTGLFPFIYNEIQYIKYDANTATDEDDDSFIGFVNRTNSNTYISFNYGEERRQRAYDLMKEMVENDRLSYRNVMQEIAKDVIAGKGGSYDPGPEDDYSTAYCISRAQTRLAFMVDGAALNEDTRLITFWVNLGEPSIGVYTPFFPYAKDVSFYVWADDFDGNDDPYDIDDSCLMNRAITDREIYDELIYESNTGDYYYGMDDKTINKVELAAVQEWTFPLEDFIVDKTVDFLDDMRADEDRITENNLLDFSDYCAMYAYENYTHASADYYEWTFSKPWDTTPPTVISTNPATDAADVAIGSNIAVEFSESMDSSTINNSTFELYDGSSYIEGEVSYDNLSRAAIFDPDYDLDYLTTYTATIKKGVEDLGQNTLDQDYSWSFTTVAEADFIRPTVVSTDPVEYATDIAIDSSIIAEFSEPMEPSSIKADTFKLSNGSSDITGKVIYSDSPPRAVFEPDMDLEDLTTYNAIIGQGVKDLAGNQLKNDYEWAFTTGTGDSDEDFPWWFDPGSDTGCESVADASPIYSRGRPALLGILNNILLILFPFSLVLLHRVIRRRKRD